MYRAAAAGPDGHLRRWTLGNRLAGGTVLDVATILTLASRLLKPPFIERNRTGARVLGICRDFE